MKVFIYIRVATVDQLSITEQSSVLEDYARERHDEVAAIYVGTDVSDLHPDTVMNILLQEAIQQDIGLILVRDAGKISRDVATYLKIQRLFMEREIQIETMCCDHLAYFVLPLDLSPYERYRRNNGGFAETVMRIE